MSLVQVGEEEVLVVGQVPGLYAGFSTGGDVVEDGGRRRKPRRR